MDTTNPNEEFASWSILQTVQLQAVATWMLEDLLGQLEALKKQITDKILTINPTGAFNQSERQRRLQELYAQVQEKILAIYAEMLSRSEDYFDQLAEVEDKRNRDALGLIFGFQPTKQNDLSKIAGITILGATLADWINKQAEDLNFKFQQQIGQGIAGNDDSTWLTRRILGWIGITGTKAEKAVHSTPGIFGAPERDLNIIIRTGVDKIADEISQRSADTMPASFNLGWQQISVLDSRTTEICRAYAFKTWDRNFNPIGHGLPYDGGVPRHWGCRSRIIPITLDEAEVKGLTFKDWLNSFDRQTQDKIFGAKTMNLFRAKKISEQQLIRQQERVLTLDQLRNVRDPRLPND